MRVRSTFVTFAFRSTAALASFAVICAMPVKADDDLILVSTIKTVQLVELCEGPPPTQVTLTPCHSYILGVVDAAQLSGELCINEPDALSLIAIVTVRRFLREHPEHYGRPPVWVVKEALRERYACRKAK